MAHRIALIPGDGIGTEVVPEAQRVLDRVSETFSIGLDWHPFDWSCDRYVRTGAMMPDDALAQLAAFDAIFLGAVGRPDVPDHVSLWGLLIPIRRAFEQYVNLRPIRLLPGVESPLRGYPPGEIDILLVRENVEGEYSEIGGRLYRGSPDELAVQEAVFTRRGIDRVTRYAFGLAQARSGRLTSATKSNGIIHTMPFWDDVFRDVAASFPDVETRELHIDALAAEFVRHPDRHDVVVGSNLFGDILSDLGSAASGSLGVAPSANLNPEGEHPSMFEPIHGSAPDIAGQGVANPVGQIWSGAMMLEHLGHGKAAAAIVTAIERVLVGGVRTPDLGGAAGTRDVTEAILAAL